ncbi:hypothetical protein [Carnobacterium maltaromaticum]|uniref:hypothetical protein n=1 Tax=Carnobacterium maltaromaticum TaxID=2751 RepID=UPI0039BDC993
MMQQEINEHTFIVTTVDNQGVKLKSIPCMTESFAKVLVDGINARMPLTAVRAVYARNWNCKANDKFLREKNRRKQYANQK